MRMGLRDRITETLGLMSTTDALALRENLDLRLERTRRMLTREDDGWSPLGDSTTTAEWGAEERKKNANTARGFATANPLAKNGLSIRASFIWGTGVGITANDETVNEIVQEFIDDPMNRKTFTGHQAHLDYENILATTGNVFLAAFTNHTTGDVQVRSIPADEITQIITNPEDAAEVWFYKREWVQRVDATDSTVRQRAMYYPALHFKPAARATRINSVEVNWSAPVYHVAVNRPDGWLYGVGDLYSSIPWARSYTGFLTDWAKLTKSVSAIAYKITGKDRNDVMAARAAMQNALNSGVPGGAIASTGAEIQSMPSTGATIDADSGQPLARMIAAGLGLPVTLLYGDPGTTGARAVAETLTKPMIIGFKNRREVWTECMRSILNHVIDVALLSPNKQLTGGDIDRTLVFDWPEIEDITLTETMDAIEKLDASGLAPKATLARLGLRALRVRDVDELVESMEDENGEFIPAGSNVADALMKSYQAGDA